MNDSEMHQRIMMIFSNILNSPQIINTFFMMKHPCLEKHKHNDNKINNMGVPCQPSGRHLLDNEC